MARKSFSKRLTWHIIVIVSVIFITMLFFVSWTSTLLTETEATRSAQYMLHGTISDIEQPLTELEVQTKTIGCSPLFMAKTTITPNAHHVFSNKHKKSI
ncbi:MAG: hypothetical protein K6D59_04660 [Bacteroidales bacterium]|nr:hypothetical protein [Bacteroidales bacterium]